MSIDNLTEQELKRKGIDQERAETHVHQMYKLLQSTEMDARTLLSKFNELKNNYMSQFDFLNYRFDEAFRKKKKVEIQRKQRVIFAKFVEVSENIERLRNLKDMLEQYKNGWVESTEKGVRRLIESDQHNGAVTYASKEQSEFNKNMGGNVRPVVKFAETAYKRLTGQKEE